MHGLESRTPNRAPVVLCVGDRRVSVTKVAAGNGPAGLGDPNPFAWGDLVDLGAGSVDGGPEDGGSVADLGFLEVSWEYVSFVSVNLVHHLNIRYASRPMKSHAVMTALFASSTQACRNC